MIQDIQLLFGALLLTAMMVWEFFVLASAVGALKAFGRRPLETRPFLALSAAALLPGCCFLGGLALTKGFLGTAGFALPAMTMATVGVAGRIAMRALSAWGSKKDEA